MVTQQEIALITFNCVLIVLTILYGITMVEEKHRKRFLRNMSVTYMCAYALLALLIFAAVKIFSWDLSGNIYSANLIFALLILNSIFNILLSKSLSETNQVITLFSILIIIATVASAFLPVQIILSICIAVVAGIGGNACAYYMDRKK